MTKSVRAAALRTSEARYRSLIRGMWAARPPASPLGSSAFYSLVGGLGELVEEITDRLRAGGSVDLGAYEFSGRGAKVQGRLGAPGGNGSK